MADAEDCKQSFEVYKKHPAEAIQLAFYLADIRQALKRKRKGKAEAIRLLDDAIEELFPHTEFHKVSRRFYWKRINGTITFKQEERLRKVGIQM